MLSILFAASAIILLSGIFFHLQHKSKLMANIFILEGVIILIGTAVLFLFY